MKKILTLAFAIALCTLVSAQTQTIYKFTKVCDNPATPVKDQHKTGTCWCFSTVSFFESELLRQGKGEFDLSEMFVVRKNYEKRLFDNYLRQGNGNINPGSICHMAVNAVKEHGIMPESAYHGIKYNSPKHNHGEMTQYMKAIAGVAVERKDMSPEYDKLMKNLFDTYLGEVPETFEYNGKKYTAKSFADAIGLNNMDDYIEITSVAHHPFYQMVPLEIPDNWDHQMLYNVTIEDFIAIIDNALKTGYTVAWDGDLTKGEFNHNRGIAICPEPEDFDKAILLDKVFPDRKVTQENRQYDLEHFNTVDDHLMHLTGIYKDQNGNYFYKTKNSWGTGRNEEMGGYLYMSRSYVMMRAISILVHKDGIPKEIRQKMGIK